MVELFYAEKKYTSLSNRVHEIFILTVGAIWKSGYELYAHRVVAREAGIPETVITSIISGQPPEFNSEQEASAYQFTRQLAERHEVDRETYGRAVLAFGNKGLVEMVMLIGLYLSVCSIINAFEVPVPE